MPDRGQILRWIRATWLGWLLGIPFLVAPALAAKAVGVGGVQGIVGLGMGAGVGLMQGRVVRSLTGRSAPWFCSCVVGLGAPFVSADVAGALAYLCIVAAGGLLLGAVTGLCLARMPRRETAA